VVAKKNDVAFSFRGIYTGFFWVAMLPFFLGDFLCWTYIIGHFS
jgi:hypothetical protein